MIKFRCEFLHLMRMQLRHQGILDGCQKIPKIIIKSDKFPMAGRIIRIFFLMWLIISFIKFDIQITAFLHILRP